MTKEKKFNVVLGIIQLITIIAVPLMVYSMKRDDFKEDNVQNALSTKADITYVDKKDDQLQIQIDKKADKSVVDQILKGQQTILDYILNNKK